MIYVALLRGINVGGNNKVVMTSLKAVFESLGYASVSTYINSGNVFFVTDDAPPDQIRSTIEAAIEQEFGFSVKTIVRDLPSIAAVTQALPDSWVNNSDMKCDVAFLWPSIDSPDTIKQLAIRPEIEDVVYVPGAIIWRIDRENVGRSRLHKLISTDLYKQMTIRNCNTVRKLYDRMSNLAE